MITIDHKERIADSASKFAAQYHEREAVIIQLQTAVLAQYSSVKSNMTHIKQCMAAMAQGLQSDVLYPVQSSPRLQALTVTRLDNSSRLSSQKPAVLQPSTTLADPESIVPTGNNGYPKHPAMATLSCKPQQQQQQCQDPQQQQPAPASPAPFPAIDRLLLRKQKLMALTQTRGNQQVDQPLPSAGQLHTLEGGGRSLAPAQHQAPAQPTSSPPVAGAAAVPSKRSLQIAVGLLAARHGAPEATTSSPPETPLAGACEDQVATARGAAGEAAAAAAGGWGVRSCSTEQGMLRAAAQPHASQAFHELRLWRGQRTAAAVAIQAAVRGHLVRLQLRRARQAGLAASAVQAGIRRRLLHAWRARAKVRVRMRWRLTGLARRYGLGMHLHLARCFDGKQLLQEEGKFAYAVAWHAWRLLACSWLAWQQAALNAYPDVPVAAETFENEPGGATGLV
ncbi:hypothetical protein V8C86DRAFT_2863732 [Haematococcus lacustris]